MSNNDAVALANRFIDALHAADIDTIREIYAPDARIWHNFTNDYQTVDDNIASLLAIRKKLSNMRYDITRLEPIKDGYLQQHVMRGTLAGGDEFAMHAMLTVTINDGRIVKAEEYLDFRETLPLRN
jgi:ketosteroid isomerase-like protein